MAAKPGAPSGKIDGLGNDTPAQRVRNGIAHRGIPAGRHAARAELRPPRKRFAGPASRHAEILRKPQKNPRKPQKNEAKREMRRR